MTQPCGGDAEPPGKFLLLATKLYNPTASKSERIVKATSLSTKLEKFVEPKPENSSVVVNAFADAAVAAAAKLAVGIAKTGLEAHKNKFLAEYKITESYEDFYNCKDKVNLQTLELIRRAKVKDNGTIEPIVRVKLEPVISKNQDAFRYKVSLLQFDYSQAKATKRNETIHLSLDIELTGVMDNKVVSFGRNTIIFKGVVVGGTKKVYGLTNWFATMPNTVKCEPSGCYTLKIMMKEANPHAAKLEKVLKFLSDNSDAIAEAAKVVVVSATTTTTTTEKEENEGDDEDDEEEGSKKATDTTPTVPDPKPGAEEVEEEEKK